MTPAPLAAVVVPVRSFPGGKSRLGGRLDGAGRADLLQAMAERVVAAAGPLPVAIVSSAREVRAWAASLGLTLLGDPGSLDEAAACGMRWARDLGALRVVVAHADLPLATTLAPLARDGSRPVVAAVPCHRDDGTPVLSLPTTAGPSGSGGFAFAYGPGSFRRHAAAARRAGFAFRVLRDGLLGRDVDAPEDLVGIHLPLPSGGRTSVADRILV